MKMSRSKRRAVFHDTIILFTRIPRHSRSGDFCVNNDNYKVKCYSGDVLLQQHTLVNLSTVLNLA